MDSGVNNWLANLIADSVTPATDKIMDAGANVIVPVSRKWNAGDIVRTCLRMSAPPCPAALSSPRN